MGIFKLFSVTKIENNLAPVKQAVTDHFFNSFWADSEKLMCWV